MRVLVVGGTGFLGSAMTEAAVAQGHRVTVLARGRTERALESSVEVIRADRFAGLAELRDRSFDLVIDTCAFTPDAVAELLAAPSSVGRYALVSSISVYASFSTPAMREDAPTHEATREQLAAASALAPAERTSAPVIRAAYGPLKRACEQEALARLGERALLLRAGILAGANDPFDRLAACVRRVDEGGVIPCPGDPQRPVQLIDVRDVASWTMHAAAHDIGGAFNLTSPRMSMGTLLETCQRVCGSDARLVWVPDDAALACGLSPWTDVPLWVPGSDADHAHVLNVSVEKATASGLRTRPIAETVEQVLLRDRQRRGTALRAGIPREKEAALLARAGHDGGRS